MIALRELRLVRAQDGTAIAEAAVSLPVFCLLLFGLGSFAIVLFGWCNLTYASRAAARYASIHSNTSLVPATNSSVAAVATPFLIAVPTGASSTTVAYNPSNTIGSRVTVTVSATYGMTAPYTSFTSFTVASTAQRTITR